jgi:hypothetical protein
MKTHEHTPSVFLNVTTTTINTDKNQRQFQNAVQNEEILRKYWVP